MRPPQGLARQGPCRWRDLGRMVERSPHGARDQRAPAGTRCDTDRRVPAASRSEVRPVESPGLKFYENPEDFPSRSRAPAADAGAWLWPGPAAARFGRASAGSRSHRQNRSVNRWLQPSRLFHDHANIEMLAKVIQVPSRRVEVANAILWRNHPDNANYRIGITNSRPRRGPRM